MGPRRLCEPRPRSMCKSPPPPPPSVCSLGALGGGVQTGGFPFETFLWFVGVSRFVMDFPVCPSSGCPCLLVYEVSEPRKELPKRRRAFPKIKGTPHLSSLKLPLTALKVPPGTKPLHVGTYSWGIDFRRDYMRGLYSRTEIFLRNYVPQICQVIEDSIRCENMPRLHSHPREYSQTGA